MCEALRQSSETLLPQGAEFSGFEPPTALPTLSDNIPLSDTGLHSLHGASSPDPLVTEYLLAARAENTRRAYDADLWHFRAWGGHMPSNPDEIARYLAHHAGTLRPVTLRRRLAALATAHKDLGLADPTKHVLVLRVIQGIERRHGHPPKQVAPLMIGDLARIVSRMVCSAEHLRDRALLLVGFFGAFRRSELIALDVDDIEFIESGLTITIRKSKTDQTELGRAVHLPYRTDTLCPVTALQDWMNGAEKREGAVFRTVNGNERLCTRAVARIIKKWTAAIGLDAQQFSGHSLRAGFATSAALAGLETSVIARQTRHQSGRSLHTYVRPRLPPSIPMQQDCHGSSTSSNRP